MTNLVTFPGLGLSFEVNRVAFTIGGMNIYWYGVLIATGIVLAILFAFRHCAEFGIDGDSMTDVIVVGVVMAIISARVYYVAMSPFAYDSIWDMLDIRQGGLAIYGGIIGAVIFGGLACRWRKVPVAAMLDLTGMGFLIGQCIGRWGNFVNGEAHGGETDLPWGMSIDGAAPVHPTFLYESLWNLIGFIALHFYSKKRKFPGEIALLYVAWYGLGRAWIEGLRTDSLYIGTLRVSQVLAAVSCIVAIALLVRQYNRIKVQKAFYVPPATQPAEAEAEPAPAADKPAEEKAEAASAEDKLVEAADAAPGEPEEK